MVIYFSGTGNSLAIARKIAEATNDQVIPLTEIVKLDLSGESRIGLVYPSYDFAPPPAVQKLLPKLRVNPQAYIFVVIDCGAQVGISSWFARHVFKQMGAKVDFCDKIRVPDCAGIAYKRNPNKQIWKFTKYASRLERIIDDIKNNRSGIHYGGWSLLGWISMNTSFGQKMIKAFRPAANPDKCIGCGTCARVCPVENITMQEREGAKSIAVIGDKCTTCLACVHFCPHQAMQLGKTSIEKSWQYHHPEISLKDMIRR